MGMLQEAYSGGKAVVAGGKGERLEGKGWRGKVQREEKKRSDFGGKEASDKDLNFGKFKNVVTDLFLGVENPFIQNQSLNRSLIEKLETNLYV